MYGPICLYALPRTSGHAPDEIRNLCAPGATWQLWMLRYITCQRFSVLDSGLGNKGHSLASMPHHPETAYILWPNDARHLHAPVGTQVPLHHKSVKGCEEFIPVPNSRMHISSLLKITFCSSSQKRAILLLGCCPSLSLSRSPHVISWYCLHPFETERHTNPLCNSINECAILEELDNLSPQVSNCPPLCPYQSRQW